ncbi:unnamed protein product [Sphagnum jensenii]|uniref:Uncharacterized protein n=1 Tax=Sphagnum jensenii TaxID=128206 RepID=A0ABP0XHH2_9BRYO
MHFKNCAGAFTLVRKWVEGENRDIGTRALAAGKSSWPRRSNRTVVALEPSIEVPSSSHAVASRHCDARSSASCSLPKDSQTFSRPDKSSSSCHVARTQLTALEC